MIERAARAEESAAPAEPARPRAGYALALVAALAYGANAVIISAGLARFGGPLAGATIALAVGLVTMTPLAVVAWRAEGAGWRPDRAAVLFVLASGLSSLFGFGSNIFALSVLPVVVVTPITSTYPLVTVLLVRLFLRRHEQVTRRTALGAVLVVAGVILVTLARA
ncbi:MAG TPA: DMT family transporter [Thermomicrobiales bacterium]|nr:DMT family transporter [Thermomicrobiales bacterium]